MDSLERIAETFEFFEDWEDRYRYLTEIGQRLPALPAAQKVPENQVDGCVSNVWIVADPDDSPVSRVCLRADSDTPVIKGILAILLAIYSGKCAEEIDGIDADDIFGRLGIYDHLSPNRHVGVYAMIERIRAIAKTKARLAA